MQHGQQNVKIYEYLITRTFDFTFIFEIFIIWVIMVARF